MKASCRFAYGPPEVLSIKDVETPSPGDDELLVKVFAATVNRTDCGILWGKPFILRFFTGLFKPTIPTTGTDFAGEVMATGKNVSSFKTGDRVFGFNDNGLRSHAQYTTIKQNQPIEKIPNGISYEQAAASLEGAHYAYNFIKRVKLQPGDWVLVNGATGAIGSAALQFLKHFGARVTAVCNTKNTALVRSLGADKIIDYEKEDFTKDDQLYQFVFDAVGKSTFGKCKKLLKPGGVYISSELGPGAQNIFLPLITGLFGKKKTKFPIPTHVKASLVLIKQLLSSKEFLPVIDRTYTLEKITDAYNYVASGQKTGNVIINMHHENIS